MRGHAQGKWEVAVNRVQLLNQYKPLNKNVNLFKYKHFGCLFLCLTAAMREILQAFEKPENKAKIQEIEQDAGNDLVKLLQDRLPFAAEIQQEVIKSHGFLDDGDQGNYSPAALLRVNG